MKKILLILVVGIFVIGGFAEVIASDLNKTYSNVQKNSYISRGNTLITEYLGNRIIEIDNDGNIVWQKTGLGQPAEAERLENGNTLIVEEIGRVIEVDNSGAIVWQKTGLYGPLDAERLDNGNTLIVETPGNRVIEVDNSGAIVWQKTGLNNPRDAERLINRPPESPTITGETQGHYGESYDYTFVSNDPENQDIRYYIDWGDGSYEDWIGPYSSGQEITVSHTWDEENTYTIRAKAKDTLDVESQWGTLEVTMPINQQNQFPLLELFRERFPLLYQLSIRVLEELNI